METKRIKLGRIEIRGIPLIEDRKERELHYCNFHKNEEKVHALRKKIINCGYIWYTPDEFGNDPICDIVIESTRKLIEEAFQCAIADDPLKVFLFHELRKHEYGFMLLDLEDEALAFAIREFIEYKKAIEGIECSVMVCPDALRMQKKTIRWRTCDVSIFFPSDSLLCHDEYFVAFMNRVVRAIMDFPVMLRSIFLRDSFPVRRLQEKGAELYKEGTRAQKKILKGVEEDIYTLKRRVALKHQQFLTSLAQFLLDFYD